MSEPKSYTKRPETVQAYRYEGKDDEQCNAAILAWVGINPEDEAGFEPDTGQVYFDEPVPARLWTQGGWVPVYDGDWILKDWRGFRVCSNEEFIHTFDET